MNSIARDGSMKTALALALALASGSAAALGLGQIELKSKLGEPLLAEIAIVSSDPEELEQLRAGLASPETFARVGLKPPDGVVAKLRFEPALNAAGDAVIRVTSAEPIDQPVLTFLIEVDWGQGRLVREYSTLLDAPRTVSAPLQPRIDAPVVAPSSQIVRAPSVAPQAAEPSDAAPAGPVAAAPSPAPVATPAPRRASAPAPVAQQSREQSEYGAIVRGETLSQIAGGLDLGVSLEQAMIALLRANPEAFIDGNINLLKQGAVLRVPRQEQLDDIGRTEASALVQAQLRQWRGAQPAVAQPAAAEPAAAVAAAISPASTPRQAAGGARLEIVPPGASRATRAGTQSGISAGGEGEMLRQELQQTRETLAARDAELAEMQSRLAELEKLQGDQSQLLSMKDAELAAAQQRLATAQQAPPPVADAARNNSVLPWVMAGIALLLALLAGWAWSRRGAATRTFRAPPATPRPSLADAFAPAPVEAAAAAAAAADDAAPESGQATVPAAAHAAAAPATAGTHVDADAASGIDGPLPFWDRRERQPRTRVAATITPAAADAVATPAWHDTKSAAVKGGATEAAAVLVPGQERLDLARAYIDLGDHVSARLLLAEVEGAGDPDHSRQATRMLRELE